MTRTMFSSTKESHYKLFNNKARVAELIKLASVAVKAGFTDKEPAKQIGIKHINDALFGQIKLWGRSWGIMFISYLLEICIMSASSKKKDVGIKDVDVPRIETSMSKHAIISSFERMHPNKLAPRSTIIEKYRQSSLAKGRYFHLAPGSYGTINGSKSSNTTYRRTTQKTRMEQIIDTLKFQKERHQQLKHDQFHLKKMEPSTSL